LKTEVQQPARPPDPDNLSARIEQSYRQLSISLIVNLVIGLLLAVVLWGAASYPVLFIWLVLLLAVTAARYLTLRNYRKATLGAELDRAAWTKHFVAGACAAGVVWGAAGVILFHPSSFPHQVFLAFVLGGMVAGAVPLLSSVGHAFRYFAIPVMVPICIRMLSVGDSIHLIMGLMIAVFGIAMLASSTQVYRLYRDSENLRRELLSSIEVSHTQEHLARVDTLTGIPNRRLFEEELVKEWGRAQRDNETLAVIFADIDYFKEYNDLHGHPAGDSCLVDVAQALHRALFRPGDVVARIGGEEFAFLLPRTKLNGALSVAEQMRERILSLNLPHEASPVACQITLSFGVASTEADGVASSTDLIRASDIALYEAKRRGRNQVAATTNAMRSAPLSNL
jgi:diguanylate cyclase (GGDEF)-like protein